MRRKNDETLRQYKTITLPTQCPFCGKFFDYSYPFEIHIPGDRKLKKEILNRSLFFPTCPHCGNETKLKANCLYLDDTRKEFICVTDFPVEKFEDLMKSGNIQFGDVQTDDDFKNFVKGTYTRRIVRDVDAFREKILLSDNNYDDRIMELIKLSLSGLMEKEYRAPVYRIFLENTAGVQLEFTAIMGTRPPYEYASVKTSSAVYNQYRDKYLKKLGAPTEDEYIFTDQDWARKSRLLKDEDPGFVFPL